MSGRLDCCPQIQIRNGSHQCHESGAHQIVARETLLAIRLNADQPCPPPAAQSSHTPTNPIEPTTYLKKPPKDLEPCATLQAKDGQRPSTARINRSTDQPINGSSINGNACTEPLKTALYARGNQPQTRPARAPARRPKENPAICGHMRPKAVKSGRTLPPTPRGGGANRWSESSGLRTACCIAVNQ